MTNQPVSPEPRTEAGKALLEAFFEEAMFPEDPSVPILAIESEARSAALREVEEAVKGLDPDMAYLVKRDLVLAAIASLRGVPE